MKLNSNPKHGTKEGEDSQKDKERKAASKAKRRKKKCDIFKMTSFIFNKDEELKNN
jgi:hypothetical protein